MNAEGEIRPLRPEEVPEAAALVRESFATVAEEFGITEENAPRFTAFAVTAERLRWQMEQGRPMFALFAEGEMAGYYSLDPGEGDACELSNLCVRPGYRHRGMGRALLEHAVARARERGCARMTLGLVEENQRLRAWYEAWGFSHIGCKKFSFFPFTCGYMERALQLP
ncbi:MAG: GNAT family N-acetyltransferase [Acutalibacter sp.]|nr:GNAT family N-acetyltransferase [Acutalibacter sp.]